jgi:hypothetical protein
MDGGRIVATYTATDLNKAGGKMIFRAAIRRHSATWCI